MNIVQWCHEAKLINKEVETGRRVRGRKKHERIEEEKRQRIQNKEQQNVPATTDVE